MAEAIKYKGCSIEQERNGTWSIYFAGNPFATRGGFKSYNAALQWIEQNI